MPLLCDEDTRSQGQGGQQEHFFATPSHTKAIRKQSQHSVVAKTAILNQTGSTMFDDGRTPAHVLETALPARSVNADLNTSQPPSRQFNSLGAALTDTPATTAPNSPRM
jgi:hypothetical protein